MVGHVPFDPSSSWLNPLPPHDIRYYTPTLLFRSKIVIRVQYVDILGKRLGTKDRLFSLA